MASETIAEALTGQGEHLYVSPPQDREQALELVALLLGHPASANGGAGAALATGDPPADCAA